MLNVPAIVGNAPCRPCLYDEDRPIDHVRVKVCDLFSDVLDQLIQVPGPGVVNL